VRKTFRFLVSMAMAICISLCGQISVEARTASPYDSSDFVVLSEAIPDILQEIRYYSAFNFVGARIDGYEAPIALMTKEAVSGLKNAASDFRKDGYVIKVYDAYRPQRAVNHFIRWASDLKDTKMKACFYPLLDKQRIIPEGYVATKSGHSKGSTIDMTIVNMKTGQELDVGEHFDYFGERSHSDYKGITPQQQTNRAYLISIMERNGFTNLPDEWWHFTLNNQPFPETYFDFPVNFLH